MATGMVSGMKLKTILGLAAGGSASFCGFCLWFGNEKFYKSYVMPAVRCLDPETAHRMSVLAAKYGLVPRFSYIDPPCLKTNVWGLEFSNPLGIAAGFDKQGEAMSGLFTMGFGFVEIGSVTPEPQPGNPTPRVFRLTEDKAVINRYGFNSEGHTIVKERVKRFVEGGGTRGVMGINLGKNKTSEDPGEDYARGFATFADVSDYLVINISSPNTPGLRNLQGRNQLESLIDKVLEARKKLDSERKPPLLVKIAPDLSEQDMKDIAAVVTRKQKEVDGLIVSNTTISRPDSLLSECKTEQGGLSGQPLRDLSTAVISNMYKFTAGQIPIIGVGGVSSGQDAYDKIRAGASLIQIYTALVYDGPVIVPKIKRELDELLRNDGFNSVGEAVGANHRS